MSKRKPKTNGLEWLYLSLASFNGSGYSDKATPENYIASYLAYKTMRKDHYAIEQVEENIEFSLEQAERLCQARSAGHTPTYKSQLKFSKYYDPNKIPDILL